MHSEYSKLSAVARCAQVAVALSLFLISACSSERALAAVNEAERTVALPKRDLSEFLPTRPIRDRFNALSDRKSQIAIGLGALAVISAKPLDGSVSHYFAGQRRIGKLNWLGNEVLGAGVPGAILGGSFWLYGSLKDKPYESHAGRAQLETLLVTGVTVGLLKSLSNRHRPDGTDDYSFPSAHAAYAFSTATVLGEFYGWKIGLPAYLLAGLTAAGRMQDKRHWFSDTVGGAAIAFVVGRAFSRMHLRWYDEEQKEREEKERATSKLIPKVSPTILQKTPGLQLTWKF